MLKHFTILFKCLSAPILPKSLIGGLLGVSLWIHTAAAANLHEALAHTSLYNPDLQAARLEVLAEAETIRQAYGRVLPQLAVALSSAHTERTEERKDSADRYRSDTYSNSTAELTWRQEIYAGGALWAAVDVAKASLGAVLQDLRATEQDILHSAITAFVNYWRTQQIAELREGNIARLQQHLQATEQAFLLGEVNRTDVASADSRLAVAMAEHKQAEGDVVVAIAEYLRIIGEQQPQQAQLPEVNQDDFKEPADILKTLAERNNPMAKAARLRLASAEHKVRFERADHLPDITASASLQHEDSNSNQSPDNRQSLIVRGDVTIPIYSGGVISSRVRQARYEFRAEKQRSAAVLRQVTQNLFVALGEYGAIWAQQEARKKAVASATLALQGADIEYRLGTRNVLDLLDSERDLVEAQISAINSESDLHIAHARMLSAVGLLTAKALALPDPMAEVAEAIENDKNIRRAIRQVDKSGALDSNGDGKSFEEANEENGEEIGGEAQ